MPDPLVSPSSPVCHRHPGRRAGIICQRCERPICPDCMVQASVGFHCPDCAVGGARGRRVITPRSPGHRPVVTQVLIALNVAAFMADIGSGGSLSGTTGTFAINWGLIGAGRTAYSDGALGVAFGQWYRLVTGGFVHAGLIHLGMNMLVLWLLGVQVERLLGPARFAALYMAALLAGSFAVMLANPTALTVGASGAIFGIMGAAVAFQRSQRINLFQSGLGGLIILNLVITFAIPGISIAGHVGGLVGGFVTGWLLFVLERRVRSEWVGVAVTLGLAGLFALGAVWAAGQYASPVLKF